MDTRVSQDGGSEGHLNFFRLLQVQVESHSIWEGLLQCEKNGSVVRCSWPQESCGCFGDPLLKIVYT
ncbi:hypothetical protein ACROYT_G011592 [Oculina patagonica]